MLKGYKKWIAAVIICAALVFSYLWTEGFGIYPKYPYGKNVVEALNYSYRKDNSNTGLTIAIATIDIKENEKLDLYFSTKGTLSCGLLRKKWNNNWVVMAQGNGVPYYMDTIYKERLNPPFAGIQAYMKDFKVSYGVIFDKSIEKITVGEKDATLLRKEFDKPVWYFIDRIDDSNSGSNSKEAKAYDKNQKAIYAITLNSI